MRILGTGATADSGTSRSRLIIGLMLLVLILVFWLAWQAAQTMQSNRDTANLVLRDYARLVADEYVRRAMREVGFFGYYSGINALRPLATGDGFLDSEPGPGGDGARWWQLVEVLFLVDAGEGVVGTSGERKLDMAVEQYLLNRAAAITAAPLPEPGFTIDHLVVDGRPHTLVVGDVPEAGRIFGFVVDRGELSAKLHRAFDEKALLPESLAGGAVTNDFVYLRVDDESKNMLFESRPDYDQYLLIRETIDNEYMGIFESYTVTAALDPQIAGELVIGGLPRSRLPLLLTAMLLTIGLLVAAILQLRREHALISLRTNFVSEVSHELRTPLTQIRMFAETLLFERFKSEDKKRRALEIINRESQRLIHLVENVLRFSDKDDRGRELNLVDTPLAPLVERVIDEFRPLADGAGATLVTELDTDASAAVDSDALRQILLNLLDNAIKYGPAGQCVNIALGKGAGGAEIRVSDQGPGIPKADRERIWAGYQRLARERESAIAGTGIGLAVVRDLVERHGGSTRVEDAEDVGARFIVVLPPAGAP